MNKYILFLLLLILNSCKSEAIMASGQYQINSVNEGEYTFDMNTCSYSIKTGNKSLAKGKFKVFVLSSEKILIVFNDIILKKTSGDVREMDKSGDSIVSHVFDGYKNVGSTIFEITSKQNILSFRKTYVNQLQKTESEGTLIKK